MTEIIIMYEIKFNKYIHKGTIQTLSINLEEIEADGIAGVLIEKGYLDSWTNNNEFELVNKWVY